MADKSLMTALYSRLAAEGITKKYVQQFALPSWWEDAIASTQAGYADAVGLISSHLGIPFDILWDSERPVGCPEANRTKFKRAAGTTEEELKWPRCIAMSVAAHALSVFPRELKPLPPKPAAVRNEILRSGRPWVSLESVLDYLWGNGIPVVHVAAFPPGKKMAGLAAKLNGRPVIIVSKNHHFQALMVFDICHELGHILCGHVDRVPILDAKIAGLGSEQVDPDEREANAAAAQILLGGDRSYRSNRRLTGPELARQAISVGTTDKVDPGVIAQNFGYGVKFFPLANAACGIIESGMENPVAMVRRKMLEHLRLEELSVESKEFLLGVAAGGRSNALPLGQ